jgi:hypothetical protein
MDDQRINRASSGMRYCNLRIAFSALCGIICVLLMALWVRSYSHVDDLVVTLTKTKQLELQSVPGRCIGFIAYAPSRPINSFARYTHTTPEGAAHAALQHGVLGADWAMDTVWAAHWFLAAISALLGTAPWARHLRFSLRTLLIATALVAAVLGLIVYFAK